MGDAPFYVYEIFKKGIEEGADYYTIADTRTRDVAFMANATYSYDGRYVINGTIRYEGSNKLGKSRSARWLPTWNVSAAWNAHEEAFFDRWRGVMSHLTLKGSYSLTADRGPSSVSNSLAIISASTPWRPTTDTQETGMILNDLENSELTYEKKNELNIGIDMGFLSNRLNVAADWYRRNNFDLIGPTYAMGIGGSINKMANVADMRSGGVELSISSKNIEKRDFKWSTNFIFSKHYTKITKLQGGSGATIYRLMMGNGYSVQGYPHRALFSIPFAGLRENGTPQFVNTDGTLTTENKHVYFQEFANLENLKYEGPTEPTMTGSLGNTFTWRNWNLNVFVTYSFGNVIRLDPVFSNGYSDLNAMPREFADRWVMRGDEAKTNIPVILDYRTALTSGYYQEYNTYNYSTERVADGGFVRMKEISLGYDFSNSLAQKLRVKTLGLKLQVTNPFLIYSDKKLEGQDPEFMRSGGVSVPVPKQFTLTMRIGF